MLSAYLSFELITVDATSQSCTPTRIQLSRIFVLSSLVLALTAALSCETSTSVTGYGADPSGKQDSASAFNKCFAAVTVGNIVVPAGHYKLGSTIVKTRLQNLIGSGSKASILECQSTNSPCVVVADTTSHNNYSDSRIQDLTIQGPGIENTSIGLFLGGDPEGRISPKDAYAEGADLTNVRITGFNHGVEWGNNAWGNKFARALVFGNATGLYVRSGLANSGEGIGLTDTGIFNNRDFGLDDHCNFEWMMNGSSFDYNGTAMEFFGATIHATNMHFEQSSAQVFVQPFGYGSLSIRDSEILVQANTGTEKYILNLWPQSDNLVLDNVSIWSNHPVTYFLHAGGTIKGSVTTLYGNGNKNIHQFAEGTPQLVVTSQNAF